MNSELRFCGVGTEIDFNKKSKKYWAINMKYYKTVNVRAGTPLAKVASSQITG